MNGGILGDLRYSQRTALGRLFVYYGTCLPKNYDSTMFGRQFSFQNVERASRPRLVIWGRRDPQQHMQRDNRFFSWTPYFLGTNAGFRDGRCLLAGGEISSCVRFIPWADGGVPLYDTPAIMGR